MRISFTITKEDMAEFYKFYMDYSKVLKKRIILFQIIPVPILLLLPFLFTRPITRQILFVICVCLALFHFLTFKKRTTEAFIRNSTKLVGDIVLGEKEIEISEDYITMTSATSETKVKWGFNGEIIETKDYIYLLLSKIFIIPLRAFKNEDEKIRFTKFIREKNGSSKDKD